jgi:hypothetical protein
VLSPLHPRVSPHRSGFALATSSLPVLRPYWEMFYPEGRKVAPQQALDRLDVTGLAVWFMDDGSYSHRDRRWHLCTDCWSLGDQWRLVGWFAKRWGLSPKPQFLKHSNHYRLRFVQADSIKLLELLAPVAHPVFRATWRLDDPATYRPVLAKREQMVRANERRTALIRTGELRVEGSANGNSKLSEEDVREIRRSALASRDLAAAFEVNYTTICRIRRRQIWGHVA